MSRAAMSRAAMSRAAMSRAAMPRPRGILGALLAAGLAAGCQSVPFSRVADTPQARGGAPATSARPAARPERGVAAGTVPATSELAAYYQRIEAQRRAQGLLRTDDGRRDAPISAGRLVQIWTEVALRDEHQPGSLRAASAAAPLRRWEAPVAVRVEFGASVPAATQGADRAELSRLTARLATATGHPIRLLPASASAGAGNFHVLVLSEDERRAIGPRLRQLVPGIDARTVDLVTDLPIEIFCLALAFARGGGAAYTDAIAIVRAEHPDLTRIACYHEELAQGLGLAADSPRARPSIFNDNMEFARLTALDLLLLRLHYDPRLRPGLREAQAAPIVFVIASELAAGES